MATTVTTVNSTYSLVGSAGEWNVIQNVGINEIELFIQTSGGAAPTTAGHRLKVLDAINPAGWGDGDVYVRTMVTGRTSKVAVS